MRFYFILVIGGLLLQSACSKKSDGGGGSSGGSYGNIHGQLIVDPTTCGTTVATITISGGAGTQSRQVTSGASFDFGSASGTYTMSAQAGSCYVQAQNVGPVAAGQTPYRVCLTTNSLFCQQNGYYKMAATTTPPAQSKAQSVSQMQTCNWITYGCHGAGYPGSGTAVTTNRSLYFYPNQAIAAVSLEQKFKKDTTVNIFATPSVGAKGWLFDVGSDSIITSEKVMYGFLNVDSQFDHASLQNTSGTCVPRNEMLNWISNYLSSQGFQSKSISDFVARNKTEVPPNAKLCIYPQTFAQTDQIIEYESSEDLELKRVWFLIIPELHSEVMKLRVPDNTMNAWFTKPTTNPMANIKREGPLKPLLKEALRPSNGHARNIANKYYLPTEEIALVYLLEN